MTQHDALTASASIGSLVHHHPTPTVIALATLAMLTAIFAIEIMWLARG
jgi:hypothetical protein